MTKAVSVIVPVFNEEENARPAYCAIKKTLDGLRLQYEIIFVDDGSVDQTWRLLRNLEPDDPSLKVIRLTGNFGQTAALSAGFAAATGEIIVTIDGDLQYDSDDMALLLEEIEKGHDIVCGWRQGNGFEFFKQRLPSRIANAIGARLFGLRVHDFSCSFRAIRKHILGKLYLAGRAALNVLGFRRFSYPA